MATPIGHWLAAYAVFRSLVPARHTDDVPLLVVTLLMGLSPDLDFIPGLVLGQPALFHQGVSHSLAVGAGLGLVTAFLYRFFVATRRSLLANAGLFGLAYASHLLLDLFGPDRRAPYGIPLLWPLSDRSFLAPVQVLPGVRHAASTSADIREWITGILDLSNVAAVLMEVVVVVPFIALAAYWRRRK